MAHGTPASPAVARRRLGPDARRAQLVELGLELIKARPFDQVLVDDVIEAAGISKGLLFHYFATKRDFQVAVIEAAADELLASLQPDPSLEPLAQLRRGIDAYIAYIEQQPATYIAIARGAGSDDQLLAVFERTRDAIVELITGAIVDRPSAMLRLGVRGWIANVEESTFVWLRDRPCSRKRLVEFLYQCALAVIPLAS